MNHSTTMHTGPLGSTIHVIRTDAGTITELAAIDWNRSGGPDRASAAGRGRPQNRVAEKPGGRLRRMQART